MRFWTAYALLALSITKAYAAGGAGGSITDLIAPTINVGILLGVLVWKLKGPLKNQGEERKLSNLDNEIRSIHQSSDNDVLTYEKKMSKETEDKTHKLKSDANLKIQADKKAIMDELNAELLNQVISKTKTTIKTNKDYQNKVSSKLIQGL